MLHSVQHQCMGESMQHTGVMICQSSQPAELDSHRALTLAVQMRHLLDILGLLSYSLPLLLWTWSNT